MIICGAGASGMFAAGTAASFGAKTLLIDQYEAEDALNVGGDCSNAACVPSKALRSAAQVLSSTSRSSAPNMAQRARQHLVETVTKVRQRETPDRLAETPKLDLIFVSKASFQDSNTIELQRPLQWTNSTKEWTSGSESIQVKGKKFIICTGASPTIPNEIQDASEFGVPILTYRSFFRPDGEGLLSDQVLWNMTNTSISTGSPRKVVILGGGPSACEMAHTLGKLMAPDSSTSITIVAPTILPQEDVPARAFCRTLLQNLGIQLILGQKAIRLAETNCADNSSKATIVLEDGSRVPVDLIICATGRAPGPNLQDLQLDRANIEWSYQDGIICNSRLQSVSAKHVFAAGDCASAIPKGDRRAAHAGWTGYHSVQSALFPRFLTPMDCIHRVVPRVTALDPEIASVGMTHTECVAKYGVNGFIYLRVYEEGTDRADMDSIGRDTSIGFVELRVSKRIGRILGATICLPTAPEIANELGLAIRHKMTCRDIAKSIHYYPSYGYLMHRVALALALGNIWGMLGACGPVGRVVGGVGRTLQAGIDTVLKRTKTEVRQWQAQGARQEFYFPMEDDCESGSARNSTLQPSTRGISFLEAAERDDLCQEARELAAQWGNNFQVSSSALAVVSAFVKWLDSKPS